MKLAMLSTVLAAVLFGAGQSADLEGRLSKAHQQRGTALRALPEGRMAGHRRPGGAPLRDETETIAYFDPEGIEFFFTLPNELRDRDLFTRFTSPEAPFQIVSVDVLLFDMFGDPGEPDMLVTLHEADGLNPGAEIARREVPFDALNFNDGGGEFVWTTVDFDDERVIFEEAENFCIVINIINGGEGDTLALMADNGEERPTNRSGLRDADGNWLLMEDIFESGINYALRTTVRYGDDLNPSPEIAINLDEYDFGRMRVNQSGVLSLIVSNIGGRGLEIDDVALEGNGFQLLWRRPEESGIRTWTLRRQFAAGERAEDVTLRGVVWVDSLFYIAGGANGDTLNYIYKFDESGQYITRYRQFRESELGMGDLAYDGRLIWGVDGDSLYGFTPNGRLFHRWETPFQSVVGLTSDPSGRELWMTDADGPILAFNDEFEETARVDVPENLRVIALAWFQDDTDGEPLYALLERDGMRFLLFKVNPSAGDFHFVRQLDDFAMAPLTSIEVGYRTSDLSWILVATVDFFNDPVGVWQLGDLGGLPSGAWTRVPIQFRPEQVGDYDGRVTIRSNDPERGEIEVPLTGRGIPADQPRAILVPRDYPTIQAAIDSAHERDTVLVAPGRYPENVDFIGKSIVVGSFLLTTDNEAYIDSTIIDGMDIDACVVFNNAEDSLAVLRGFTLVHGIQNFGGGIDVQMDAKPLIQDLKVTANRAMQIGAGIYCTWYSRPLIQRVRIWGNWAGLEGGGMGFAHVCHPTVEDAVIWNNFAATNGGGIYAGHGDGRVTMNNSVIRGNTAPFGGGAHFSWSDSCFFNRVEIEDNHALTAGGGVYILGTGRHNFDACRVRSNHSDTVGGAFAVELDATVKLTNSIIQGNQAVQKGGGLHLTNEVNLQVNKSEFSFNLAAEQSLLYQAGGCTTMFVGVTALGNMHPDTTREAVLIDDSSSFTSLNSLWWQNGEEPFTLSGNSSALFDFSDIQFGRDGIVLDGEDVSVQLGDGVISNDPGFGDIYNRLNFNLPAGSPCIDAGTALYVIGEDTVLTIDEEDYRGEAPDIGAYEFQPVSVDPGGALPPARFGFTAAYPNPFNGSVHLEYTLEAAGVVNLEIYDLQGRWVTGWTEGVRSAGSHSVVWRADETPAGMFVVRLAVNGRHSERRLLLIK